MFAFSQGILGETFDHIQDQSNDAVKVISMTNKDQLFDSPVASVDPFAFNEAVARVFPDMIERSVPGYRLLIEMTPLIIKRAVQANSRIYDLGCSLGAATLAARRAVTVPGVNIVGIDNSPHMVARAQGAVRHDNSAVAVEIVEGDITTRPIENASVVMLYFTLQFVPPHDRPGLLKKIHDGMRPGGTLVLAEKLAFGAEEQAWMDDHHIDFKKAQGYSDLEIAQKRQAIENVLIPQSEASHQAALAEAGFQHAYRWFQALNFACFVAIK